MSKIISLELGGYWREVNIGYIPEKSGIYVVYECTHDSERKTVSLHKVIYVGESENVNARIKTHEKWPEWRRQCGVNRQVCFSFAPTTNPDRERGEAALIYKHKPPVNEEYKYSFPFPETTMDLEGKTELLSIYFTVFPTTVGA